MLSRTGFYVGAHLGGAWSDVDWASVTLTGERVTNDASGFFGGAQMGYNQQFGNIILGLEATLSGGSLSDNFRSIVDPAQIFKTDINTIVTVTGRLGVATNQWMIYAKAGWAGADVRHFANRNHAAKAWPEQGGANSWQLLERRRGLVAIELIVDPCGYRLTSQDSTRFQSIGFPSTIGEVVGPLEQGLSIRSHATLALALNTASSIWAAKASPA